MYLLNARTKQLEEFIEPIPPYAILSHTWGRDELLFRDVMQGGAGDKKGWLKVDLACRQAIKDGQNYVWIDTCCIDKTSSAELSEAINSMFQWYRGAEVCYVYLQDVLESEGVVDAPFDEAAVPFEKGRWFSRGWTLQELIAPAKVEFYDRNWIALGTKYSLADQITNTTGIPAGVLNDPDQLYFSSVAARMSWAADRETTRVEDRAYCLLGLFGVNMPLLYGEGSKAYLRLQEEIIKLSDDQSIFAWSTSGQDRKSALAEQPQWFAGAADIVPIPRDPSLGSYSMSHTGLMITLPIIETSSYYGGHKICFALLQAHFAGDFTRQIAVHVCETDTQNVYARCQYRGAYIGTLDAGVASKARSKTIYITSPWKAAYSRPREAIIQLQCVNEWQSVHIAPAEGVTAIWKEESKTLRLVRSPNAFGHDMAAGFVLQHPKDSCELCNFLLVAYFPHKSSVTTTLAAIEVYQQPVDWTWKDWLHGATQDLSLVHVREVLPDQPKHISVECHCAETSTRHVFRAKAESSIVFRQEVLHLAVSLDNLSQEYASTVVSKRSGMVPEINRWSRTTASDPPMPLLPTQRNSQVPLPAGPWDPLLPTQRNSQVPLPTGRWDHANVKGNNDDPFSRTQIWLSHNQS